MTGRTGSGGPKGFRFPLATPSNRPIEPPACRAGAPLKIPLRAYLSAREIREPDFEATHPTAHPHSFLVDCPTGDSLPIWRCLAQMYSGTTFGQRPHPTLLRAPNPLGNPGSLRTGQWFAPLALA